MKPEALVIGAHPDDIENGAGSTIMKLQKLGYDVVACILTAEADEGLAEQRRSEARKAASVLAISQERVLFLNLPDGSLSVNRSNVSRLRETFQTIEVRASVVLTHTINDSHNDHRAVAELVLAAFRNATILHFAVVNSLISSAFKPRVFVNIDETRGRKLEALRCHASQDKLGRIEWENLDSFEKEQGRRIAANYAEAFEVTKQMGAEDSDEFLRLLNDSPFNQFWHTLLGERTLVNLHAIPRVRTAPHESYDIPGSRTREAVSLLRRAFHEHWVGNVPLDEYSSDGQDADLIVKRSDILLEGGPVANRITLTYFNHIPQMRYVVDYDVPDFLNIRIRDRYRGIDIPAEYRSNVYQILRPRTDRGILTLARNPMAEGRILIGCMGIHADGTNGCIIALYDSSFLQGLQSRTIVPFKPDTLGYQVLLTINCKSEDITIDWDTLHRIPC